MNDHPRQRPYSGPLPNDFPLVEWGGERLDTWEDYYRVRDRLLDGDGQASPGLVAISAKGIEEQYDGFTHD